MKYLLSVVILCLSTLSANMVCGQVYYPSEEESRQEQTRQQDANKENSGSSFTDKLYVGGGFGLSFGDVTYIQLMPMVGYRITPKLSAGLRFMYQYTSRKYYTGPNTTQKISSNDFGVGPFARMMLFGPIYAQVEYEYLNYEYTDFNGESTRYGYGSFMAGGGIIQPIGGKAAFFLTALYNFSYDANSTGPQPYGRPYIIRAGITAGF
jgi:hypothetical protein